MKETKRHCTPLEREEGRVRLDLAGETYSSQAPGKGEEETAKLNQKKGTHDGKSALKKGKEDIVPLRERI